MLFMDQERYYDGCRMLLKFNHLMPYELLEAMGVGGHYLKSFSEEQTF